jgi:hypothetical protein
MVIAKTFKREKYVKNLKLFLKTFFSKIIFPTQQF